jgi:hypothetical protein
MKTISMLFFLLFLVSCKPEKEISDNTVINNTVIIGVIEPYHSLFKPIPEIRLSVKSQDSLDLNSDGIFEIIFIISPIPTKTGIGSETNISTKNELQILLSGANYPAALNVNSVLNNDSTWSVSESERIGAIADKLLLESYACYSYFHCLGWGNFQNVNGKYLGFRMADKFGWIMVDCSKGKLVIKEYTVLKK